MAEVLIQFGLPVALIVLAMTTGTILERRHFRSIEQREETFADLPILTAKEYPTDRPVSDARLVSGSVVVSIDHFKRFLASLRGLVGGEVRSYCSLLDRGRREALLRMKESARGADLLVNVRIETSSISKGRKNTLGSAEVFAYGTALTFRRSDRW